MNLLPTQWPEAAETLLPDMIALRRAIHADPELGLSLPRTTQKVKDALAGLPLSFREGPSTTGLVAILEPRQPGGNGGCNGNGAGSHRDGCSGSNAPANGARRRRIVIRARFRPALR